MMNTLVIKIINQIKTGIKHPWFIIRWIKRSDIKLNQKDSLIKSRGNKMFYFIQVRNMRMKETMYMTLMKKIQYLGVLTLT